jgi:Domain of unknown function (DUF6475)
MTSSEFVPLFSMLCEVYNREWTKMLSSAYFLVLQDLTKEEFEKAIKSVLAGRKYSTMPLPADFLEAANGNPEEVAIIALNFVIKAIGRVGIYQSVDFQDAKIHATIEAMGGWQKICLLTHDEWKFASKEFVSTFKALLNRNVNPAQILVGQCDQHNIFRGVISSPQDVVVVENELYSQVANHSKPALTFEKSVGQKKMQSNLANLVSHAKVA